MASVVQTLPPSINMLQPRPNSADRYHSGSHSHHQHSNSRSSQKYGSTSSTGYRGIPSSGPVAPYAFTATPSLAANASTNNNRLSQQLASLPPAAPSTAPQLPLLNLSTSSSFSSSLSSPSKSTPPSPSTNGMTALKSLDDVGKNPGGQLAAAQGTNKGTPDRYRRNVRRTDTSDSVTSKTQGSALPSGSGMIAVGSLYNHPSQSSSTPSLTSGGSHKTNVAKTTDDMVIGQKSAMEQAARYRRRSFGNIETPGLMHHHNDSNDQASPHPNSYIPASQQNDFMSVQPVNRPASAHRHTGSSESVTSVRSGQSSRPGSARNNVSNSKPLSPSTPMHHIARQDVRLSQAPVRANDNRRVSSGLNNPSPLSRPMSPNADEEKSAVHKPNTAAKVAPAPSPAAAHLAALNEKEAKKSKSKLRRAFSFGSAAELRKATVQANLEKSTANTNKRASRHEDELDPESARIAAKQEAAGLGESIYSGQGNFFTGSTDNLSISSTASSASIMLRKMGKGMKKGGRSLVGLFRPKSVVGVPAADGPLNEASAAQVSMVTVEAEREKVNVNLDPHAHQGGGTGFPKLERNSLDNKMSLDSGTNSTDTRSRRSIVGGERERAEVLAAVKKGILKRTDSGQGSPQIRPIDTSLPNINHGGETPRSSAPSTPKDDPAHRRGDSVKINDSTDDYFGQSSSRYSSMESKKSQPITAMRNIHFSPRIQFHDTWPSGEYDRRGEIATCNRLTPMLAQQIKEELNTFKMEMEVHESSKVYTHFF